MSNISCIIRMDIAIFDNNSKVCYDQMVIKFALYVAILMVFHSISKTAYDNSDGLLSSQHQGHSGVGQGSKMDPVSGVSSALCCTGVQTNDPMANIFSNSNTANKIQIRMLISFTKLDEFFDDNTTEELISHSIFQFLQSCSTYAT